MTTIVAINGAVFVASLIAIAVGYPSWMWALVLVTFWGPIVIVPTAGVVALVGRARRRAGATAFSRR